MAIFKCKMCGGTLEINESQSTATCEYCFTQQTLPKLEDDRRANLYDRANHFRRNNEFDKAMSIYETILNEDSTDAEAYWSLVLCRYGIEYVEDPASKKRMPTVNRAQFTSVFDDDNYKSALRYADSLQKSIYEQEATAINEIQKGILAISQKEEPFDVFVCYKETDNNGRRTQDSVLANELYHQLIAEGFKVFFSRITLEDKLGVAYEPYIFAALNSARVMVVLGTRPEYFNAVWVKNEWSRYLALVRQSGGKKVLIPAYRDMDPYDLPEEFSHLQAQDMGKLGFMQDLIRGIKKLAQDPTPQAAVKETVIVSGGNTAVAPLLKRVFMYLEDREWQNADEYAEKVLDQDPENAEAYLGKLLAELRCPRRELLKDMPQPFQNRNNYQKVCRFGSEALKEELEGATQHIIARNEETRKNSIYQNAQSKMSDNMEDAFHEAAQLFQSISGYKDADALASQCLENAEQARLAGIYREGERAMQRFTEQSLRYAADLFWSISSYKDAQQKSVVCQERAEELRKHTSYNQGQRHYINGKRFRDISEMEQAEKIFQSISGYRDADKMAAECRKQTSEIQEYIENKRLDELKMAEAAALAQKRKKRNLILTLVPVVTIIILIVVLVIVGNYRRTKALREALAADQVTTAYIAQNYPDLEDDASALKEFENHLEACHEKYDLKGALHTLTVLAESGVSFDSLSKTYIIFSESFALWLYDGAGEYGTSISDQRQKSCVDYHHVEAYEVLGYQVMFCIDSDGSIHEVGFFVPSKDWCDVFIAGGANLDGIESYHKKRGGILIN